MHVGVPFATANALLLALAAAPHAGCSADPGNDLSASAPAATTPAGATTLPAATAEAGDAWKPPVPRSSNERADERQQMVREQIEDPTDLRTPVRNRHVLDAMLAVPRHAFIPDRRARDAYTDYPLPIGNGQTISQPYIVALMTEHLQLKPGARVLEIGTGSGYQAAVLAQITPHTCTIEIIEPLAQRAEQTLRAEGYEHVKVRRADGYFGWPEAAPFDAIIVTCAAGHLPPPLWEQLKPGGHIVIPIGGRFETQRLVVITKTADGRRRSETITQVRFVPMTGRAEEE